MQGEQGQDESAEDFSPEKGKERRITALQGKIRTIASLFRTASMSNERGGWGGKRQRGLPVLQESDQTLALRQGRSNFIAAKRVCKRGPEQGRETNENSPTKLS